MNDHVLISPEQITSQLAIVMTQYPFSIWQQSERLQRIRRFQFETFRLWNVR